MQQEGVCVLVDPVHWGRIDGVSARWCRLSCVVVVVGGRSGSQYQQVPSVGSSEVTYVQDVGLQGAVGEVPGPVLLRQQS